MIRPLNGTKTHPLSKHAIGVLRDLAKAPVRSYLINPGVNNRLCREALVEFALGWTRITEAGRERLKQIDSASQNSATINHPTEGE